MHCLHAMWTNEYAYLLTRYAPPLKRDQIIAVDARAKHTPFRDVIVTMMNEVRAMKEMKGKAVAFDYGTQPFENWAVQVH